MEIRYKWLLDFCSYYNGKENCEPDHTSGMLWEYERVWVMKMQNCDFSQGEVNEYKYKGCDNHLIYDCKSGYLLPLEEVEEALKKNKIEPLLN